MKFLITGGAGFLGANLASAVLKRNQSLIIFDNLTRTGSCKNLEALRQEGRFLFINGDIRIQGDIASVLKEHKPDVIFHLAGQVAMSISIQNPLKDFEVNALGTLNLLESIRNYAPGATLVYSSTNKVYGDLDNLEYEELATRYFCKKYSNGIDESFPLDLRTPYGCSKGTADQYVLDYARMFDLQTVVCRHSSIYGERQFATHDQGWVGWFCKLALNAKLSSQVSEFSICGNGKQVRDVLHVDDAVQCYFSLVENIGVTKGEVFNIGGTVSNSMSILELFSLLQKTLSVEFNMKKNKPRKSDQKVFIAKTEKIYRVCGWEPLIPFHEGVDRMLVWQKTRS